MKQFMKEFGTFISKGNALDLAVGIVIGGAFNMIIKSLVADIIMPLIGLIAKTNVTDLYVVLRGVYGEAGAVVLTYGNFIQTIVDFLIIALAIFLALKLIMRFEKGIEKVKKVIIKEEATKQL
ncbi:MAG: large conductance mechanosensitive channel protein MscL [Candidatus Izemoplasmatales bacterium]|nr:large conductance mechanosensitive channel protein MscL [Candidatus Izemoplasmatales bacterium]